MSEPDNKPKPSAAQEFLERPAVIGVMILIAIAGAVFGYLDGWYALVLIGIGLFGIYRSLQKRKGP